MIKFRKNLFNKDYYLHTSMYGSYKVECRIVTSNEETLIIEYIDAITNEKTRNIVHRDRVTKERG